MTSRPEVTARRSASRRTRRMVRTGIAAALGVCLLTGFASQERRSG